MDEYQINNFSTIKKKSINSFFLQRIDYVSIVFHLVVLLLLLILLWSLLHMFVLV